VFGERTRNENPQTLNSSRLATTISATPCSDTLIKTEATPSATSRPQEVDACLQGLDHSLQPLSLDVSCISLGTQRSIPRSLPFGKREREKSQETRRTRDVETRKNLKKIKEDRVKPLASAHRRHHHRIRLFNPALSVQHSAKSFHAEVCPCLAIAALRLCCLVSCNCNLVSV